MVRRIALVLFLLAPLGLSPVLLACSPGRSPKEIERPRLLESLGDLTHPVSTWNPEAQRYFDQGLILTFGFNHEAAVRSFAEAARLDPACAMCFWGIALALGPNINAPMGPEAGRRAYAALQQAQALAAEASPREQAYIAALAPRYAAEPPSDRAALDRAYAEAMAELHGADPTDVDAATLYAEALMDLSPWDYWTEDAEPREHTEEVLRLLEAVLEQDPNHVGANHYYIHAVEKHFPERAEAAADRLGRLAPDVGHLVHMPSHIYWRLGRYEDATEVNIRASAADEAFFSWCRGGAFYSAVYYPHNLHFLWAAAAAEGRSNLALTTARRLAGASADRVGTFPFVQEFLSIPMLSLARFGQWDALLAEPSPPADQIYLKGIWHYTRGLAFARTGDLEAAAREQAALDSLAAAPAARQLVLAGGTASASTLLSIGAEHLEGELAAAHGRTREAVDALERAVAIQDGLAYMEPPPWYFPTRQALGAVLLDAGRAADAESVYRKDLEQYPRNGWSLFGLAQSLRAQGREAQLAWARQGFEEAWARADVKLSASRF